MNNECFKYKFPKLSLTYKSYELQSENGHNVSEISNLVYSQQP